MSRFLGRIALLMLGLVSAVHAQIQVTREDDRIHIVIDGKPYGDLVFGPETPILTWVFGSLAPPYDEKAFHESRIVKMRLELSLAGRAISILKSANPVSKISDAKRCAVVYALPLPRPML